MSKVYRIHGARFLRKYTAAEKSSNYAYMADVRKIADTLCKVPWTRVSGDVAATTTIHTEEGLDWNEPERDRFDAAEWCGEHADGFHRAFAQAACYVFKLPATAVGKAIEKIRVNVTSDPYNPYGARIAAMTSATLEIPMDCQTVREGEVFRAPDEDGMGAAPRLYRTNQDGTQTWYANSEIVELEPGETLTAKQYLFVFVALENYNRGRDGWIEGSSYIDNDVELTLSAAASDFVDGEINDCSQVVAPVEFNVLAGGVLPDVSGDTSCVIADTVTAAGTSPVMVGNHVVEIDQVEDETAPANNYQGVRALYAHLATGEFKSGVFDICHPDRKRIGVGFNVRQGTSVVFADESGNTCSARSLTLTSSALIVPFSLPSWKPEKVLFDWASWLSGRSPTSGVMFAFYLCPGKYLTKYDVEVIRSANTNRGRGDFGSWKLIGTSSVSSGSATLGVDLSGVDVGTFLIVAYMPQDSIANSTGTFSVGTSDFWYDSVTPDEFLGGSLVSAFDLSSDYQVGSLARMNYNRNILTFSKSLMGEVTHTIFANGVFVGNSISGIVYSEDGVNWSASNMGQECWFRFAFNGEKIVAVTSLSGVSYSKAYYSADGKVWTPASISEAVTSNFSGCVVFGGKFYAYENGVGIFKSEDGTSWSKVYSTRSSSGAMGLFVCGDRMFLGGKFFTDNGNDFSTVTSCPTFDVAIGAVKLGSNYFVFDNDGGYIYGSYSFSRVGEDEAATPIFNSVAAIGSTCVASSMDDGGLYYSSNGHTWTKVDYFGDDTIMKVLSVGGEFFALRQGVHVSENGLDWTTLIPGKSLSYLAKSDSRFVVTGLDGAYYSDLRFGSVYECIANESAGSFSPSNWRFIGEPVVERLHGDDTLCVPNIKLIG